MSKTYKRYDQKDKADKSKKSFKHLVQDQSTKQALQQFVRTGDIIII